ncbi:MAG: hypothetical protein ACFB22_09655 [Rhodothalassiaceae bacterium]
MIRGLLTLTALACVTAGQPAWAGAWTLPKGAGYNKAALNLFFSDDTFGPAAPGFERFSDINVNYYGEYGLQDNLTLIGQLLLRRSTTTFDGDQTVNAGAGDFDLGLRYNFLNDGFVLSGQFLFKGPYLYDEDAALPLGNGQEDFEFRLQLGRSLHPFGYFGVEAAYRLRLEEPADEFRYLIEYGFDATENLYLRTKLDVIESLGNTDPVFDPSGNPNFPFAFDLGRLEGTAGWRFSDTWSGEFTFTRNLFGDNILRGNSYQFGLIYEF